MTGQLFSNPVSRKVNGEAIVVLGWGRAILMQVSHPLIAAGVAEHSAFGTGTIDYLRRSYRTISAMLELTYGSQEVVRARADAINGIHRRVHGHLSDATSRFPRGTPYSATDPGLLSWVHATLVESQLTSYQLFVGDLSHADRDRYCAEAASVGPLLGIPPGSLPETEGDLSAYLDSELSSDAIEVTETAREVAGRLLRPTGWLLRGLLGPGRLVTVGLLPNGLRQGYGFAWGHRQQRSLDRLARAARLLHPVVPRFLREWPIARNKAASSKM